MSVTHSFVNQTELELADYACICLVVVLVFGYLGAYFHFNTFHPYTSLSSHVRLQRVEWTRSIFSASKHRMNVIDCLRSSVLVLTFYVDCCVTGIAAISRPIFSLWTNPAVVRHVVPTFLLFGALGNFAIVAVSYYYLNWHAQVEEGATSAEVRRARTKVYFSFANRTHHRDPDEHRVRQMDRAIMKLTMQRSAAIILQAEWHFHYGWRTMSMGLATMLWVQSPYAMLVASVLLVANFFYNDFPFPPEVHDRFSLLAARSDRDECRLPPPIATPLTNASEGQRVCVLQTTTTTVVTIDAANEAGAADRECDGDDVEPFSPREPLNNTMTPMSTERWRQVAASLTRNAVASPTISAPVDRASPSH